MHSSSWWEHRALSILWMSYPLCRHIRKLIPTLDPVEHFFKNSVFIHINIRPICCLDFFSSLVLCVERDRNQSIKHSLMLLSSKNPANFRVIHQHFFMTPDVVWSSFFIDYTSFWRSWIQTYALWLPCPENLGVWDCGIVDETYRMNRDIIWNIKLISLSVKLYLATHFVRYRSISPIHVV